MTTKTHKKHANLAKPKGGKFHRSELAIIGAPCGFIQDLAKQWAQSLSPQFKLGYADAAHGSEAVIEPFHAHYIDQIGHHQMAFKSEHITFEWRNHFRHCDGVLINGNHFPGEQQIVILHESKRESLQRKLDRLTDVCMFILTEGVDDLFPFLKEHLPHHASIPTFSWDQQDDIASCISSQLSTHTAKLNGIVLAGGQSKRMGTDKGSLDLHGKPQREFMADLLAPLCEDTFISVRDEQAQVDSAYPLLHDRFLDLGPMSGILSAFHKDPNSAWLTVATDVPLVNENTLKLLIAERDTSQLATCFLNESSGFPEPLITIWEPRAYPRLLEFLANGYSCPRKVLINSSTRDIDPPSAEMLMNVNTPEDLAQARELINKKAN